MWFNNSSAKSPWGINQSHAVAKIDVLDNQVAQKRCLPGTSLTDDIDMLALVDGRYAKGPGITPAVAFTDCNVGFVIHGSKISRHPLPA